MGWERIETIANIKFMNIDLRGFFKIIGRIIDVENKKVGDDSKLILYEAAYPDYVINESDDSVQNPSNIITYSVATRDPAPLGSKTQLRPIDAARYRNTDTGEIWTLLLMRYINQLRFDAFAPSATETEDLMEWFEKFMDLRMQMIEYIGLERIVYRGRGLTMTTMRSGYHNRSALYDIITQEHYWNKVMPIKEMIMQYGLADLYQDGDVFEFPVVL